MLSVTCPKCSARYSMSEELYRRKGGGEAVVVTCRKCKSEIRFEAPDEKTRPSNEPPMQPPAKLDEPGEDHGPFVALSSGFFGASPAAPGVAAPPPVEAKPASNPGPALSSAEPSASTEEPIPASEMPVSEMPVSSSELFPDEQVMSVRSEELESETETVPLVVNKATNGASANPFEPGTNPKLKKPLPPPRKKDLEKKPEDEEEGPPSSSGTPTLTALMGGATISLRPTPKNRVDEDFFAGLSGTQSVSLAPPTIDVSSLAPPEANAIRAMDSTAPDSVEPAPESIPVSTRSPHKKKKKKKHGASASHAPPSLKPSAASTAKPVTKSTPVKAEPQPEQKKGSSMAWLVALGAIAIAGFFYFKSQSKPAETAQVTPTPEATTTPTTTATTPTTTATVEATAAAPTASAAAPAPTTTTPTKPGEATLTKPGEAKPAGERPAETKPTEEKPAEAKPAEEKPAEAKPAEEKPAEAASTGAGPFQPEAAKAALAASAAQAAGCRKGDDPTGSATVIITFAPSGRVTSANVSGPPFAGTATGGCIAAAMRKTKVPPFDGDRITVSKTVQIQ